MDEQLVRKIISILLHSIEPKKSVSIAERDQFLSLLCIVLLNAQNKSKFGGIVNSLLLKGQVRLEESEKSNLSVLEIELANGLSVLIEQGIDANILSSFVEICSLVSNQSFTKIECILLYEAVLQRLQEAKGNDPLATDFTYFYLNEALVDIIEPFVPMNSDLEIYDPFSQRGEMLSYFSSLANNVVSTSESLKQSPVYIKHKLALSNVLKATHFQRTSLSGETTIDAGKFDFALTACIASASAVESPNINSQDLKGHIDPRRINIDILDKVKSESEPKPKFKEHALIQQMLWSLKKSGTALIITSKGPLQREQEIDARAELVINNKVNCVIRLHDKVLGGRAMPTYAFYLKKSDSNTQLVQFIDARSLFSIDNAQVRIRDKNNYLKIIKNRQNIEGISRLVSVKEVEKNNFNLCPEAYILTDFNDNNVDMDEVRSQLLKQIKITDELFEELFNDANS